MSKNDERLNAPSEVSEKEAYEKGYQKGYKKGWKEAIQEVIDLSYQIRDQDD